MLVIVFLQIQIIGCIHIHWRTGDELTQFNRFQFSYRNPFRSEYFSLLFSQSDTFFLKKYSRSPDSIFYSVFPSSERWNINEFVKKIDLLPIDSVEDMNSTEERFSLYLNCGNETHGLYLHSLHPPAAFVKFNDWINKVKDSSNFIFVDTVIKFKEDKTIHSAMQEKKH